MKTIMQKYEIIRLKKEGWSDNKISKTFGVSRNTIQKYWRSYRSHLEELLKLDPNVDTHKVIETLIDDPVYDYQDELPESITKKWISNCVRSWLMKKTRPDAWDQAISRP